MTRPFTLSNFQRTCSTGIGILPYWKHPDSQSTRYLELDYWAVLTQIPSVYDDIIDLVLPVLRERGMTPKPHAGGALRERFFGTGRPVLPDEYPDTAHRVGSVATGAPARG